MFDKIDITQIAVAFIIGSIAGGSGVLSVFTYMIKKWNVILYPQNERIMVSMNITKKKEG